MSSSFQSGVIETITQISNRYRTTLAVIAHDNGKTDPCCISTQFWRGHVCLFQVGDSVLFRLNGSPEKRRLTVNHITPDDMGITFESEMEQSVVTAVGPDKFIFAARLPCFCSILVDLNETQPLCVGDEIQHRIKKLKNGTVVATQINVLENKQ